MIKQIDKYGEKLFADPITDTLHQEFRKAHDSPKRIPAELKPLIATTDFPEKLVNIIEKTAVQPKSNQILRQ